MVLYPSCLFNRTQEAKRHLVSAKEVSLNFGRYPYHIVDLSVRMRPIVEVVNEARNRKSYIKLLKFERSEPFSGNDKYIKADKVEIWVLLGAIIHERYINISAWEENEKTIRLDVVSDRGRWIVKFSDFMDSLQSYIMSPDEIAGIVCDMIDNYTKKVRENESEYRTKPPVIGNFDLDWLLWDYMVRKSDLKKAIMSKIFNISQVPEAALEELRFSANSIGHKDFELYIASDWRKEISGNVKRVSWTTFSNVIRSHLDNKQNRLG